jgi:hypothetical protein
LAKEAKQLKKTSSLLKREIETSSPLRENLRERNPLELSIGQQPM